MKLNLLSICLLLQITAFAQSRQLPGFKSSQTFDATPSTTTADANNSQGRVMSTCADKVNYVGNIYGIAEQCGGVDIYSPYTFFQVYPGFSGFVTRVDVRASKIVSNVNAQVIIYDLDANNFPSGNPLGTANVNINGTWAEYGANFASPVAVNGGFAAAVFAPLVSDSFRVACSPDYSQTFGDNAFAYDAFNGLYTWSDYKDFIIRPTISFTMPTLNLTATPNSACIGTMVDFVGGSSVLPGFFMEPMYNTFSGNSGYYVDFGDGSAIVGLNPTNHTQHSYSTVGTKVASYNIGYGGWNSTCTSTINQNVVVNPGAVSSFSYGTNNLLLTVVNTSSNATAYNWNFGDLTTSTLQNPPVHDYGLTQGAGSYVVELTTTGTCGNGYQATTINVAPGTSTGIHEAVFDENIFVYPNPVTSMVTIDYELLNNKDRIEIYIVDNSGKIVKAKNICDLSKGSLTFDVNELAAGRYFIKLSSDKRSAVRTFVKQ